MKAIQKYVADDGTEFATQHDALGHEQLCQEIWHLMQRLRPRPDLKSCSFENGAGYVQQVPADFLFVQAQLCRIGRRYFTSESAFRHFDWSINATTPQGDTMVARFISDGCPAPVWKAWSRIACTDDKFREWGQQYYASHPNEAQQVDLTATG